MNYTMPNNINVRSLREDPSFTTPKGLENIFNYILTHIRFEVIFERNATRITDLHLCGSMMMRPIRIGLPERRGRTFRQVGIFIYFVQTALLAA